MSQNSSKGSFVARNNASAGAGRSNGDAWRNHLQGQTSSKGTQMELEMRWLRIKGGTGDTYADLWHSYLNSKGVPKGGLSWRKDHFFRTGTQA